MGSRSARIDASDPLTDRERQILAGVAEGLTNQEIAEQLYIGFSTVKTHLEHARTKLGARNSCHAAILLERQKRGAP